MLSSGIIDLAIGLAFVFGVTAALASVATESISRFLGLRGAYLLGGLRELLDSEQVGTDLTKAEKDYDAWKNIVTGTSTEDKPQSATGAVLGSPILRSQGMVGDITSRKLLVQASKPDRPSVRNIEPRKHAPRSNRRSPQKRAPLSDLRSLPAYISPTAFADAVIDLLVPKPTAQTTPAGQTTATGQTTTGQTTLDTVRQSLQKIMSQDPMPAYMAPLMPVHRFITIAALLTGAAQFIFLWNLFESRMWGRVAPENPWNGTSLEWSIPSPPPWNNFGGKHPVVFHDPYQYGVKGSKGDYVMQDSPEQVVSG